MRILIDIGHPAHVHYFRNFIKIMENKGHEFLIISRNKELEHYLLINYNIPFFDRGKGSKSVFIKLGYMLKADYLILKEALKFKPDLFLSFGSIYPAHVSFLLRKPHIAFDDTEHSTEQYKLYSPFTEVVLTPSCFNRDLGKKQIRFNGYMELCYLHPNYFKPDPSVLELLVVKKDEKYIIMRFVSWNASHDVGHSGLSLEIKRKAVKELSKYAKVFISSEGKLPEDLKKYQIKIPPERMHDALYYASMYFGESGTMASESAILGTPAINIATSALYIGVFADIAKYDLMYVLPDENKVLKKVIEIMQSVSSKKQAIKKRNQLILDKIDVTAFMVWFIENYPESIRIMKNNPDYQNKFKCLESLNA